MTPAQLVALKAAILADTDQAVIDARSIRNDTELARLYNLPTNPAYIMWKTSVSFDEIMNNGMDWTRVDNLSVGKARIWDWMTRLGTFNPTKPNIRAGIDATWVGTTADLAVRAAVYAHCKRTASKAEKLYATGAGTDASPSIPGFEGEVTISDIGAAMNS